MYDILLNGQVVAVVVPALSKAFVETLIKMCPEEFSVQTRVHKDETTMESKKESK